MIKNKPEVVEKIVVIGCYHCQEPLKVSPGAVKVVCKNCIGIDLHEKQPITI